MAKLCPITNHYVVYLTCLECEDKPCKNIEIQSEKERENEQTRDTTGFSKRI